MGKDMILEQLNYCFCRNSIIYDVARVIFLSNIKTTIQNNARFTNQHTISQTADILELVLKRYEDSLQ
ncbi:hypothetical protein H70357_13345 [Paenibacillus sp. FSL H7-0357]|nr:hypothetical protein H70357_13345 [Paenibacillus sp. FSL H7-0357]